MEKLIAIRGQQVQAVFTQHKIKLANDAALTALLAGQAEAVTEELVRALKDEFNALNGRQIDISDASMAVEIWGHVYADRFAAAIKMIPSFGMFDALADKITGHCAVIDMGETGRDNNRFVWDRLASFKSTIAARLA